MLVNKSGRNLHQLVPVLIKLVKDFNMEKLALIKSQVNLNGLKGSVDQLFIY